MVDSGQSWFYILTTAFAFGIFVRSFWVLDMFWVAGLLVVGLMVWWAGRGEASSRFFIVSLILLGLAVGIFRMEWASWSEIDPDLEAQVGSDIAVIGIIRREPENRSNSTHLYVETSYGLILVKTALGNTLSYGDKIEISGRLEKPEMFETDMGRTFNYPGYLLAQGVSYTIGYANIKKIGESDGLAVALTTLYSFKQLFMKNVERILPEPQAGLGEGLLLGVKRALGDDLEQTFRQTGIIHIVVLSGYNVMIVVTFILYILGAMFGRKLSTIFGLFGIATFALLVGLGATVVRASIMASLLLIMGMTGRVYLVLRGLFLAGAIMLLWNPYSLAFDVGFQLSFLATLGLILFSPFLANRLRIVTDFGNVREFITATLATQLFVSPLLLYQMGEFSVVAVLVNVLVLPMVAVAMLLTFLTGITAFLSTAVASMLGFLAYLSLTYIIVIAEWFGNLSFASIIVPPFSFWLVPIGYGLIGLMIWQLNREPDELKGWTIVEIAS